MSIARQRVTIVRQRGDEPETWIRLKSGTQGFGGAMWQTLTLAFGDRRREALTTLGVLKDPVLVKRAMIHMASWTEDTYHMPAVRVYVYGPMVLEDESSVVGLALLLFDLEGTLRAIFPVEEEA